MAHLYVNANGKPVTVHSYSSGSTFNICPRKYSLEKRQGWRRKRRGASLDFGICVESAIQFYHANKLKPMSGVAEFQRLWAAFKDRTDLDYTAKEGSWGDCNLMGSEMLALYEVKLPSFGYTEPVFQLNYRKVIFPGSHLGDLEFTAYIDVLAKIQIDSQSQPIIIDIKTGSTSLDVSQPAKLMLDGQLRAYAFVTGVPLVGFLWFTKARPEGFKKGDKVTLLVDKAKMHAGDAAVVLSTTDDGDEVKAGAVLTPSQYAAFEEKAKGLKGKALEAVKADFGLHHATGVHLDEITRQRVQFVYVRIPDEDIKEAGESIGMEIVNIHAASESGTFPKRPGVRWPNNWCDMCDFLPICTGDDKARDEQLYQIGAASPPVDQQDWLAEFEEGE